MTSQDYVIILLPVPQNCHKGYYYSVTLKIGLGVV